MHQLAESEIESIKSVALQHGVANVRAFGSRAKGTANANSDLDLLVRFERPVSLMRVIGFQQAVEERLGMPVDVVEEGGLSRYLEEQILSEAVQL